MSQIKIRVIPLIVIAVLAMMFTNGVAFADTVSHGPHNHPTAVRYRIGSERIKFKAQVVYSTENATLNALTQDTKYWNGTHVWDDAWYYWSLPDNRARYLLLTWYNTTADEYGWLVLDKDSDGWWYKTNSNGWQKLYENEFYTATWHTNGYRVDIDIRNPRNTGDWNQYDIWYSFGE